MISIIIPTFNNLDYLKICIDSIRKNSAYDNEIILHINEGTLYPLLNRMEQNGWLESSWNIPKTSGHPKREYKLSKKGEEILPKLLVTYEAHNKSLNNLKGK